MTGITSELQQIRSEKVAEWTRCGLSASIIADRLGISTRTVVRYRVRANCLVAPRWPVFTAEEIARAEAMFDDGASYSEVARTIGRSVPGVAQRFRGRGWTRRQAGEFAGMCRQWKGLI